LLRCPGCGETIEFPAGEAGTVGECPECGGWVDVPELTRSPRLNNPHEEEQEKLWADALRQNEAQDRLIEAGRQSHEEWKRQLEQSARYQDQAEESFRRFEALLERWESLSDRVETLVRSAEQRDS